jgi:oligopeptide/dipeptide ABC transporter ATP-binding protein
VAAALRFSALSVSVPRRARGHERDGEALAVTDDVSFVVRAGSTHALVGESGSGKTLTALAAPRLLPHGARITQGGVTLETDAGAVDLTRLDDAELRRVRGRRLAMVFQEPMTALDPLMRAVDQVREPLLVHGLARGTAATTRAEALLTRVGIPRARAFAYPHELSGGQRQRVMLAVALAAEPAFVIADEPTTALDVTVQASVLTLFRELVVERSLGLLLITHDLGVVAQIADDVSVMYAGQIVEQGGVVDVFSAPRHPYTRALLRSRPQATTEHGAPLPAIRGAVPAAGAWPSGCRFRDRCDHADDACATAPTLVEIGARRVRCVRPLS